jgi:hypothetical protein
LGPFSERRVVAAAALAESELKIEELKVKINSKARM